MSSLLKPVANHEEGQIIYDVFPDQLPKGRLPDREYFFNILNTLNEPYFSQLVEHAHLQRSTAAS